MKLFLGEYDHALDDRGRVTLPKKIREELGDTANVILTRGFDPCLFGFDRESWEKEAAKHLEAPITDDENRKLRRYLFSGAEKVEIDKLGRILLPALLQEYASVGAQVMVIGAGDHFEIWDKAHWQQYVAGFDKSHG